eukprot:scaffold252550_cov16-Tisochrysis_lutea.AAC.1
MKAATTKHHAVRIKAGPGSGREGQRGVCFGTGGLCGCTLMHSIPSCSALKLRSKSRLKSSHKQNAV